MMRGNPWTVGYHSTLGARSLIHFMDWFTKISYHFYASLIDTFTKNETSYLIYVQRGTVYNLYIDIDDDEHPARFETNLNIGDSLPSTKYIDTAYLVIYIFSTLFFNISSIFTFSYYSLYCGGVS